MTEQAALTRDDELALLKERATTLGIPFKSNIGLDALRERVRSQLEGKAAEAEDGAEETDADEAPARRKARAEIEQEIRDQLTRDELKLVRCRIYNLNPSKRDIPGEIITVANKYIGTIRKMIPFGEATDNGYHIPQIIYTDLVGRKFQHIQTKEKDGRIEIKSRLVPEFNIEVLPPLTEDELNELALQQSAVERLGVE